MSPTDWILSLDSPSATLEQAGGKGANLARLWRAGFPVPGGFLIATRAYHDFVAANGLADVIFTRLARLGEQPDGAALEAASAEIRARFAQGELPPALGEAIGAAYRAMDYRALAGSQEAPVAVRSSATAEDLPEMSFAGQQDTYLNILGQDALLKAVIACWGSLWTARAIGYRLRNRVDPAGIGLAVVVQEMVQSETSGVLFTANPLTGLRSETVIDAAFGLGEALVSGRVEPDHYVVDAARGLILEKTLGAKALSIHGLPGGGTREQEEARRDRAALSDEQILELASLGRRVADEYGAPQDIEWACAGGQLFLLQSRAITSLFPIPEGVPAHPLHAFFSLAAVQGVVDPLTPLGRDALMAIFARGAGLLGYRVDSRTQTVLYTAGERLWINLTSPFRSALGHKVIPAIMPAVEPSAAQALPLIFAEPDFQPARAHPRPGTVLRLVRFFLPLIWNVFLNLRSPRKRRQAIVGGAEALLVDLRERLETSARLQAIRGGPRERLAQTVAAFEDLAAANLLPTFLRFISLVASGVASFNLIRRMVAKLPAGEGLPDWDDQVMELTRGLAYNPTTEMDLDLWKAARAIRQDPPLLAVFRAGDGESLARDYQAGRLPGAGQALIDGFLRVYGLRGLAEIDLGRPRWVEQPQHIFDVLGSYLQIDDPDQAPDVVFARGAQAAEAARERIVAALRRQPGGWIKARQARFLAGRIRELMGGRESPKFFAVRMMGMLRAPLLEAGAELARAGDLDQAGDVMFLSLGELKAFVAGGNPPAGFPPAGFPAAGSPAAGSPAAPARDWKPLIRERRAAYERELRRRQLPRLFLSDGRAFYAGMASPDPTGASLSGSPVSPGTVEGRVRVVLDPRSAGMRPGEILVCPGTDPSWTPLFLSAGGLIMEMGGMMTHGAVVAREYGIPAIVGLDQATRRLTTGQRIRMDGSTGRVEVVGEGEGTVDGGRWLTTDFENGFHGLRGAGLGGVGDVRRRAPGQSAAG